MGRRVMEHGHESSIGESNREPGLNAGFVRRVLAVVGIFLAIVCLLLLLWYTARVLLIIFAAVLIAVLLRALSEPLSRRTPLSSGWALLAVIMLLTGLMVGGALLLGGRISTEIAQGSSTLPQGFEQVRHWIARQEWGQWLLSRTPPVERLAGSAPQLLSQVSTLFSGAIGALVTVVVILFVGLFLAMDPKLYQQGIVRLVPLPRRARASEILHQLGYTLRWWLIGRSVAMIAVAAITGFGLWLLNVPLALSLGILAGLLNFIPNLGPVIAGIPAVLIALTQQPITAAYVALLYLGIQSVEGYLITPLVQQRTVSLPPAMILSSQLVLGTLMGGFGVALATPLTAVLMVLVKMVYVEDILGDNVELPDRDTKQTDWRITKGEVRVPESMGGLVPDPS